MQRIVLSFLVLVVLACIGTIVYSNLEGWTTTDALYFTVVTLATVGYGDHTPLTQAGKLFTVVYVLVGVTAYFVFASAVSHSLFHGKR
jgi:voltage-gated potassium channel Kch